jgi:hypothetical protein
VATLDRAHAGIQRNWRELEQMPRMPAQQRLFAETAQARLRADRALLDLRAILLRRDIHALGQFADTELYPALDPVATRLQKLSDLAMVQAQATVRADVQRG